MNFRLEWRDVFSESEFSLDDYFIDLGQRYFQFYQTLQQSQPIKFSLTINQQIEFNKFFTEIQQEYSSLFGLDIVASVRRLGLITFRVAMILTSLRLMDGKPIESVIVCDYTDFRTSLIMARVLLQHTAHVFGQLPSTDSNATRGTVTVLCQTFFDNLPTEFNRRTYLSIAERLHVAPKTAEKYIRKFCTTGQLKHLAHDSYSKP